ncbi:MAG: carboxypeptidase regulatory-like domain-containing protein [Spirochaetes bacterium]|nr:carboxypeptidase regulatory-like domain-containing protein [Spirochaetota bacterium]
MKKVLLCMGAVLCVVAALFLGLSGCRLIAATDGYVIDAKTGEGIAGATVIMDSLDSADKFETGTDADGYYLFDSYKQGRYELTASLTGKIFTKQVVEVTGIAQTLPNIGGFKTTNDLTIVVFWDRDFADVDAYMTAPDLNYGPAAVVSSDFYSGTASNAKFFPGAAGRPKVYYDTPILGAGDGDITLDVDNQGQTDQQKGGPETITVAWIPFPAIYTGSNIYTADAGDPSKLPAGNYNWVGVLEYYLDAFTSTNTSATGPGTYEADAMLASVGGVTKTANPVVYVFVNGAQAARYTLPQFTDIKTASVLRVNMFVDSDNAQWFQILPDTKAYKDSGSIKSLQDSGIIVVGGKSRR